MPRWWLVVVLCFLSPIVRAEEEEAAKHLLDLAHGFEIRVLRPIEREK